MNIEQITTIVTGVLQGGGVLTFLYFLIHGLKKQIAALNSTVDMQSKTLEVMEKRIEETQGIGEIYKNLIKEMPDDLKKYKDFIRESKDSIIEELKIANKEKDEKHRMELETSLSKIQEQQKNISELLDARKKLVEADILVNAGLDKISTYFQHENIRDKFSEFRTIEVYIQNKGNFNIYSNTIGNMKLISGADESSYEHQCVITEDR